jgi:hypothetical protein
MFKKGDRVKVKIKDGMIQSYLIHCDIEEEKVYEVKGSYISPKGDSIILLEVCGVLKSFYESSFVNVNNNNDNIFSDIIEDLLL